MFAPLPRQKIVARPEAITFPLEQTALIVVDMQNAYATPGATSIWRDLMFQLPNQSSKKSLSPSTQHVKQEFKSSGFKMVWTRNMLKRVALAHPTGTNLTR
ncbi:putative isochorismatase family protein, rutB [Erwinia tracheiphila PSU-1]|nr:putative isochorismatase family protein, rutB [Erwinia tracheiphila PSU-1]